MLSNSDILPRIGDLVHVVDPDDYQALKRGDIGCVVGYPWNDWGAFISRGVLVDVLGRNGEIAYRDVLFYPFQITVTD